MKTKRYELVILFMLVSWGLACGFSRALGFLLFPDSASLSNWTSYLSRVYFVYGLSGFSLGIFTWLALRQLDFHLSPRSAAGLAGGFCAAWLTGLSLQCFVFDPNASWASNIGFAVIGALCGLAVGLLLRQQVVGFNRRLFLTVFLFAVVFLLMSEFTLRSATVLNRFLTFNPSIELLAGVQAGLSGLLAILVILFTSQTIEWIHPRRRDFWLTLLCFGAGDALSVLASYLFGSNALTPWICNALLAAGWGAGMALSAHRPRSIPFYAILCVSGITLGRIFWLSAKIPGIFVYYPSSVIFNLFIGGMVGLFVAVGARRLATVLLMAVTGVLAAWIGSLLPFTSPDYSLARWVVDILIACLNGAILVGGMFLWGILKPGSATAYRPILSNTPLREN